MRRLATRTLWILAACAVFYAASALTPGATRWARAAQLAAFCTWVAWLVRERVRSGDRIPWGFGVAWADLPRLECVCVPVPFNVVLRLAWVAYCWMIFPFRNGTWVERRLNREVDDVRKNLREQFDARVNAEVVSRIRAVCRVEAEEDFARRQAELRSGAKP